MKQESPNQDHSTSEAIVVDPQHEGVLEVVTTSVSDVPENAGDWSTGFPYFGEAADALDAIDLWNRSRLQSVLYRGSRCFLGDRIFCRLSKVRWAAGKLIAATVEVLDPENNTLHRLLYRAK